MANEIIQLKNMETGEQEEVSVEELISLVKK
jgi:histidyl-tRNA synthetase